MPHFLGTRSNSRHISGSILGRSEPQVLEKLARRACAIGGTVDTKTSAHGNGGPTNIPKGCFCPVRLLSLLSFHSHTESKGLCMHTHCALSRGGPLAYSSYDTGGRTSLGVLQGDQRHTPALLPLWVD